MFGFCGWWEVWAAWDRLAAAGLNHLQDSIISPRVLFQDGREQPSDQAMDALRWAYERADQAGICYSRMLASDQVPGEFFDRHPGAAGGGWYGMCTLDPSARSFQNRYLTTVAATAGAHSSAGVYVLYGENTHRITDHPLAVAAFAAYLREEYQTLEAFNPDNPNFDPELHLVNLNIRYPDEYVRAAMFQGCFHGMSAANLWVFQRNEGIDSMLVFQPRVMASYLRTSLDLRRLTGALIAFQQAPSEAAILYSMTSIGFNPDHLPALRAVYEGTFFADTKVGFVTERTIAEGALAGIKLLLVPAASHVPEHTARAVAEWADAGGALVLVGDCLVRDRRNRLLPELLPERAHSLVPLAEALDPDCCRAALEPVIEQSVSRPFRAVDTAGEPLIGVEMRTVETVEGRLVYAINMNREPVTFDLLPRPQATLIDLLGRKSIELPRTMPPLDVMVLRAK